MEFSKREQANQRNATKSTGPTTPTGKAIASRNGTKMGVFSRTLIFEDKEEKLEYERLLKSTRRSYRPVGSFEKTLADKITRILWVQIRVDKVLYSLLLQRAPEEANILRFVQTSNLPNVEIPGIARNRTIRDFGHWLPKELVLTLFGSRDDNDASREREGKDDSVKFENKTTEDSQKSGMEMRLQTPLDTLFRYKDILRRDFQDSVRTLMEAQVYRRRCDSENGT